MANQVEAKTDSLIHSARDAVDAMIDNPALEEASDKILDAVEDAVESAVDSAIDAAEDAAGAAMDTVAEMLGLEDEPAKEEKPKRKTRRKKSDS
jgi:cytochrome P450